jgi:NAD(P)-dependent dehydrogenase (short-subunit alcohol dehydrogenase family)
MDPPNPMTGKTIGITGGGKHLGGAMALGLAALGADVFIGGRTVAALERVAQEAVCRGYSGRVRFRALDVTDTTDVERFLDFTMETNGSLHGWVNNAAGPGGEILGAMTASGLAAALDGCLTQVMLTAQAAAQRMGPGSAIVNIASMYGMVSPQPGLYEGCEIFHNPPAYGAAKAGVIQFTRYAATHWAERGIRVNCISPGPFPGDSVQAHAAFTRRLAQRVPLGRIGRPAELVGPVAFLLSNDSSYITGHNLVVDGGWTLL